MALPERTANHLVIRIVEPMPEDEAIRAAADAFACSVPKGQPIDEVRNTIFPSALADDFPEPSELAAAYLEDYDFIRGLGSSQGTYFGRICAYPRADDSVGLQLEETTAKLRKARAGRRATSKYELNIYCEHKDRRKPMGFPCMTHLAYHLEADRLDCLALYRNHDLIRKGYGNYLGLAQLLQYLATACDFAPGELLVVAGHAFINLTRAKRDELQEIVSRLS